MRCVAQTKNAGANDESVTANVRSDDVGSTRASIRASASGTSLYRAKCQSLTTSPAGVLSRRSRKAELVVEAENETEQALSKVV